MGKERNDYRTLVGNPKGRRPPEKLDHSCCGQMLFSSSQGKKFFFCPPQWDCVELK
jgi:hypothetical protein